MRKVCFASRLAALTVSVLLLAAQLSPSAAADSPTPQPSPAETPPPQGLQHPLPTAAPEPANNGPAAMNYYVVSQNGLEGVVNEKGQVVMPFQFASIETVGDNAFFAIPCQAGLADAKRRNSGFLYGLDGKIITNARLRRAEPLGYDLIATWPALAGDDITQESDDEGGGGGEANLRDAGAIRHNGSTVVPHKYTEVMRFGNYAIGLLIGTRLPGTADFYNLGGSLVKSMPSACQYDEDGDYYYGSYESSIYQEGDYLIFQNPNGKYGVLDGTLNWVVNPVWDSVEYADGAGQFIVQKGSRYGIIDEAQNIVVPVQYEQIQYDEATGQYLLVKNGKIGVMNQSGKFIIEQISDPTLSANTYGTGYDLSSYMVNRFYNFSDGSQATLYDKSGRKLVQSEDHFSFAYSNGVIIDDKESVHRSDVYDAKGTFLISIPDDITEYIPEYGYFIGSTVYDCNGNAFPLPENADINSIECLSADRFLVGNDQGIIGLCDSHGNWIFAPDEFSNLYCIGSNYLLYDVSQIIEDPNS